MSAEHKMRVSCLFLAVFAVSTVSSQFSSLNSFLQNFQSGGQQQQPGAPTNGRPAGPSGRLGGGQNPAAVAAAPKATTPKKVDQPKAAENVKGVPNKRKRRRRKKKEEVVQQDLKQVLLAKEKAEEAAEQEADEDRKKSLTELFKQFMKGREPKTTTVCSKSCVRRRNFIIFEDFQNIFWLKIEIKQFWKFRYNFWPTINFEISENLSN